MIYYYEFYLTKIFINRTVGFVEKLKYALLKSSFIFFEIYKKSLQLKGSFCNKLKLKYLF